jgi:DNA repair exonuclease SbcCD ATPase subunit
MDVRILSLRLRNFKGVKSFDLETDGDVTICGDNGTGKTTVFDAFTWLLFDKDSLNSANFDIKPLDEAGEAAHGLEHSVEGTLSIDGSETVLKKIFTEIWTKKRGSAHKTFVGHTTEYFVDGVPVKLKEYKDRVGAICDESLSKLLTNPRYFNEVLSWQDRRKAIVEMCGGITDAEVIKSTPELAGSNLLNLMGKHSVDDFKKILASKKSAINTDIEKIPIRIDEIQRSVVDVRPLADIRADIERAEKQLAEKRGILAEIEAGGGAAILESQKREIQGQIWKIDKAAAEAKMEDDLKKRREANRLDADVSMACRKTKDIESAKADANARFKSLQEDTLDAAIEIAQLRAEWRTRNDTVLEYEQSDTCPTCGQPLPEDQLAEARTKAQEAFNADKAEKLRRIDERGLALTGRNNERMKAARKIQLELEQLNTEAELAMKELEQRQAAYDEFRRGTNAPPEPNPERDALVAELNALDEKIKDGSAEENTQKIKAEIVMIEALIAELQKEEKQHEANARIAARVTELSDQERELSKEYETIEGQIYLVECFIRAKVALLEKVINSKFEIARFKLFETQINEGLKECCVVTIQGVPYWSANNAARINVGIDICNTMADHYGKTLPMFCDNAEAVNELTPSRAQQIRLVVSRDPELRVETQAAEKAA